MCGCGKAKRPPNTTYSIPVEVVDAAAAQTGIVSPDVIQTIRQAVSAIEEIRRVHPGLFLDGDPLALGFQLASLADRAENVVLSRARELELADEKLAELETFNSNLVPDGMDLTTIHQALQVLAQRLRSTHAVP